MADNTQARAGTLQARGDYRTPYIRAGWESARKGEAFNYDLVDRAVNHYAAAGYETGRQLVLALRLAGEAVNQYTGNAAGDSYLIMLELCRFEPGASVAEVALDVKEQYTMNPAINGN